MGGNIEKSHLKWIDAAKGIAILAVIIDHSTGLLFSKRIISLSSYFSVTVFVFLAGITSYYSSERHKDESIGGELIRKIKSILIPYAVATCIYQFVIKGRFNFGEYINHLLYFDITPPFYFVVFFLQLIFISPYIYRLIEYKKEKSWHCLMVVLATMISLFCIRYTFIIDVWGGGKYLLGGSYLLVYLLGELFACYGFPLKREKRWIRLVIAIVAVFISILWLNEYEFKLDLWLKEPFGTGLNPPGITLMVYSGCIIAFLYYAFSYIEICKIRVVKAIYMSLSYIGRYSLYIFLYHKLVLDYFLIDFDITNIWAKRLIYISAMLVIPIIIKMSFDKIRIQMNIKR